MLSRAMRRLRALIRKDALEHELDEELRYHLERQVEANMREGMRPEEARLAARRTFGGVEQSKERCREARGISFLEESWQDTRYAVRMLWKNPGFTFVVVVALALGIGANTTIFSVVNGVLLRPLPYEEPDRLVRLSESAPQFPVAPISYQNFLDWREQNRVFTAIAVARFQSFNLTGVEEAERLQGRAVSGDFFNVLGVKPAMGRSFLAEEDRAGANRTCIVSQGLWQRRFGSDPNLVGKELTLNKEKYTVIGVLPPNFRYGTPTDVFVPLGLQASSEVMKERSNHQGLYAVARLRPGMSLQQAETEMRAIASRLAEQYPESNANWSVKLTPLHEYFVGDIRPALLILLGAVGLVLLIACANVANLLLARGAARGKEIAIRTALGASRMRVVRQLLTESLLLAALGGVVGLFLAMWGVDLLSKVSLESIPSTADIRLDGNVFGFTLLTSLLTGVIFGLAPALQASKTDLNESLKEGARSSTDGAGRRRVRSLLVVSEIALSLVLLIGAGLLIRSFLQLRSVNLGFDIQNLLTMQLPLSVDKDEGHKADSFFREVEERLSALPGVSSVALSIGLPIRGGNENSFAVEGRTYSDMSERPLAVHYITNPRYLETMNIRLLKGRFFNERDTLSSPRVAVIDEELARQQFPNEEPLGKFLAGNKVDGLPPAEIIGVVAHVRHYGAAEPEASARAQLYYSYDQFPDKLRALMASQMSLIVRTSGDPMTLVPAVRRELQAINKDLPVYNVSTMEQMIGESVTTQRFSMILLGIFAAIALILATVGIYGVMAYTVTQRTHEIGIRLALGAQTRDVMRLIVGQGMRLVVLGITAGLVGAFVTTRLLRSLLYGVGTTDALTFAGVAASSSIVALLACYIPARRAMRVDPIVALRYE